MGSPIKELDYHIPVVQKINHTIKLFGEAIAWANVLLILVILTQVVARYGFNHGMVVLEELMWHLYALAFMVGLSYAMINDAHIRVDLVHMQLPRKAQHVIEILGILFLLLPFIMIMFLHSVEWVLESYRLNEGSPNPTGLQYRWLIKGVVPLSFFLLGAAAISRLIQETLLLFHRGKELEDTEPARVSLLKHLFKVQQVRSQSALHQTTQDREINQ